MLLWINSALLLINVTRYGAEAGQSSVLMAGTARNVALVYIDMSGIGRRALLRRAGKEYVKGKLADRKS
jgi:spartin